MQSESAVDPEVIRMASAKRLFRDIDETDSVDVPVQLLEELKQALWTDSDYGRIGATKAAAEHLVLWVDTH